MDTYESTVKAAFYFLTVQLLTEEFATMSPGELEAKGFSSLQADRRRGSDSDSSPTLAGQKCSHFTPINHGPEKMSIKYWICSHQSVKSFVLGAQKTRLIETLLLSTHNICFSREIRFFLFFFISYYYLKSWSAEAFLAVKIKWIHLASDKQKAKQLSIMCLIKA